MSVRHAGPFIRDVFARFRRGLIDAGQAAGELELSRSRFYGLYSAYLRACAERRQAHWLPGRSDGGHRQAWPAAVIALLRKLLGAHPPAPYSFAAFEVLRRHGLRFDRASIRRFALRENLAPDTPL